MKINIIKESRFDKIESIRNQMFSKEYHENSQWVLENMAYLKRSYLDNYVIVKHKKVIAYGNLENAIEVKKIQYNTPDVVIAPVFDDVWKLDSSGTSKM